ncbi:MAG: hypothetical protein HQK83_00170 [Fibrobacteria bacterium]|nr:hypothetical protein [Fibrobacteria bacterium]
MTYKFFSLAIITTSLLLFSGCSNTGMFTATNRTNVELSQPNYEMVATNVTGKAKSGYVLGVSCSMGGQAGALALFRVMGRGHLYHEALTNLWKNYEEKHGSVAGKKLALVNIRYDADLLNLLLYTQVGIAVRADVVEFK